jgi:hypothetical protein
MVDVPDVGRNIVVGKASLGTTEPGVIPRLAGSVELEVVDVPDVGGNVVVG